MIELFNGYVQIFEKDYQGKTRKLIAVRKMADLQYNENELVIEKEQLARKKPGRSLRRRLGSKCTLVVLHAIYPVRVGSSLQLFFCKGRK